MVFFEDYIIMCSPEEGCPSRDYRESREVPGTSGGLVVAGDADRVKI